MESRVETEPEIDALPNSESGTRSWRQSLDREVRTHPFGYAVLAVALVVGPILITMIFPQVSVLQAVVGGVAFGVYLALCAVPQKFM
jgi:hypothetical protein